MKSCMRTTDNRYCEAKAVLAENEVWCAERPSENHVPGDNWQSDPMNPAVCWKYDQAIIDSVKRDQFDTGWKSDPKNDTLMLVLYELYKLATGTSPTKAAFWSAIKDRFVDPNDNFFDGSF